MSEKLLKDLANDKLHLTLIDRYYSISDSLGDDLQKVATAIRQAGATQKPSIIMQDIEALSIDRYSAQINYIHSLFSDKKIQSVFVGMLSAMYRCGAKYGFDPIHEVRKGEILIIEDGIR